MRQVKQLKEFLEQFPDDAFVYGYEGATASEGIGVVVVDREEHPQEELGFFETPQV
jgi:hypothetical protein